MNYEHHLLSSILRMKDGEDAIKKLLKVGEVFILAKAKKDWLIEMYRDYGKLPSMEAFYSKFGTPLPEPQDSIEFYADRCREDAMFSMISDVHEEVGESLSKKNITEAVSRIQRASIGLTTDFKTTKEIDYQETTEDRLGYYLERQSLEGITGIPTGWDILDNYTRGWQEDDYVILFSKSKSYKSFILLRWVMFAWLFGKNVMVYTREMNARSCYKRIDAMITKTPYRYFKHGFPDGCFEEFQKKLQYEVSQEGRGRITVLDFSGTEGMDELDYIASKVAIAKPDILFVDGVYLIEHQGNAEWERIKKVSNKLRQLGLRQRLPIVGTTQATKTSKGNGLGKGDVGGTVAFEQDTTYLFAIDKVVDTVNETLSQEVIIKTIATRDDQDISFKVIPDFDTTDFHAEMYYETEILTETQYEMTPF